MLGASLQASAGKIAGRVTSMEREPLPGVNVVIEELSIGAATDLNGEYVILNVPAGSYTLKVTAIGYQNVRLTELRVSSDQTTREDFELELEVLEGQEVVVTAERRMVHKDLTASQKVTTSEEIKELPVETFLGVLTTQAGVNLGADGALHVRGGRSNEIGYYIDGVSVANPFTTNGLAVNISNKALDEMKVVSGAFNAEYGNAMSGIVNIQIKEGGPDYDGSVTVRTGDYVSGNDDIFMNIDDVNILTNKTMDWTFTGPIPLFARGKFTFNFSGRYAISDGYLYGVREHLPTDAGNFYNEDNWYYEMGGDSSYVAMEPSERLNTLTKLTYRFTPKLKISAQYINDSREYKVYTHDYRYNPDGTYQRFRDNSNLSFKINQSFGRSYYTMNYYQSKTDYHYYVYEDPEDERYVSEYNIIGTPSESTYLFGGTQMGHFSQESTTDGGKFDITSQVTTKHEMKVGVSVRIDDLEEDEITIQYDSQEYREPTVLEANTSPYHTYYNEKATFFSGYIQDKIEYPNMIINVGLRGDYFDPNADYIVDLLAPEEEESWEPATIKKVLSPRLGVSFPITDEGILHFSYGHFYQMPSMTALYNKDVFGANLSATNVGNPNLKPEKTVLYEFGLQQQMTRIIALEATVFYKDIRDLLAVQSIHYKSPTYGSTDYSVYLNKDYGAVKGLALSFTKRWDRVTKTSAFIDYSYQITEGNDVSSGAFFFNALTGLEEPKEIVPLDWDQSHVLNATVTVSEPGKWSLSAIGNLAVGWPYTPDIADVNYIPEENSARKPLQRNIDLRASKAFNFGGLSMTFLVQVYNLFDTLNEKYVYDDTGRAGYTFINRTTQETEGFKAHYGEVGVHTWEEYIQRPSYYMAPRSIQFGLSVDF